MTCRRYMLGQNDRTQGNVEQRADRRRINSNSQFATYFHDGVSPRAQANASEQSLTRLAQPEEAL
jgi:cell division protein YceG involved in septum cleavage